MNMNQYSRTLHDVVSLQQMQGIFSNQESSFTFIKQINSRSQAGPDLPRVTALAISAAMLPLALIVNIHSGIYSCKYLFC